MNGGVLRNDLKRPADCPQSDARPTRRSGARAHGLRDVLLPDHPVAEGTLRQYVRERKQELGWSTREAEATIRFRRWPEASRAFDAGSAHSG